MSSIDSDLFSSDLQNSIASLFNPLLFTTSNTSSSNTTRLVILNQSAIAQEKVSKDGQQSNVHIVVKNTPFQISVGLIGNMMGSKIIDFNLLTVEATLLFDCPGEEKPVPFMKIKPIEYRGRTNDRADTMNMDIRIQVLTSHHEGMLFKIKFTCMDPRTQEVYPYLSVTSDPIRVISKLDQVRKRKVTSTSCKEEKSGKVSSEEKNKDTNKRPKKKARTTVNDRILDSLSRIEDRQKQHHELLESMTNQNTSTQSSDSVNSVTEQFPSPFLLEAVGRAKPTSNETDLESAYNKLVDLYAKLPAENRAEEIRKILRHSSTRKTETFCEMISLFNSEGLQKEMGRDFLTSGCSTISTACDGDCPHKRELMKIDEFYNSLLMFPCTDEKL